MRIIDVHAHVNKSFYKDDFESVLNRARENEVGFINIGTNLEDSKENLRIAKKYDGVWAIVGVHPTEKEDFDYETFKKLALEEEVVGVGECGFDYFRDDNKTDEDKERQRKLFVSQIELAKEVNKPLMLHLRTSEAYDDAIDLIKSFDDLPPVIFHFYSGNMDQTRKILEIDNAYVSVGGVITFTSDYDEVIREIPMERILLETDSPFVSPKSYRGKRNEPSYIVEVPGKLAQIKGISENEVVNMALSTTKRVFGLK